jgi:cell division protein FtsB
MKFEYNPEISLGNILQILTIVFGIGAGYAALVNANQLQDQILLQHDKEINAARTLVREAQQELNADVKELSQDVRKLDEKFTTYVINESVRRSKQ